MNGVSWSDRVLSKAKRNRLLKPDIIIQASVGARSEFSRVEGAMAAVRKWQFKAKFRANTYGWRASSLAISAPVHTFRVLGKLSVHLCRVHGSLRGRGLLSA